MVRLGRKPSRMACRDTENAPEITAWEAMTVASVARMTSGMRAHEGPSRKNGLLMAELSRSTRAPWPR